MDTPHTLGFVADAHAMNRLARSMSLIDKLPGSVARRARTMLLRNLVPFVGTAKLDILELSKERAVVSVRNWRGARNHIGTIHGAVTALLAETATGFVVAMNIPDDRAPVIKSIAVEYRKRAKGALRAEAMLTVDQAQEIRATEKGDTVVAVRVTDETGLEPVSGTIVWAWTPKRRAAP